MQRPVAAAARLPDRPYLFWRKGGGVERGAQRPLPLGVLPDRSLRWRFAFCRSVVASPPANEAVPVSQRPPALEALTARWHIAHDDTRRRAVPVITATSRWWRCSGGGGGQDSRSAMEIGAIVTALTLCIALLWESGDAIKCWECNSHADPRCADPFDNTSLPIGECAARHLPHYPDLKATMCRKIRQKVNGNWRFIRSCAFLGEPGEGTNDENYCLMRTGTYDVFVETCTCKSKDGCNTASQQSGPLLLLALGAAAATTGVVLGTLR